MLEGKVAIITGASRGIGAAIARRFAAEGAAVALVARTAEPGGKLAGSLNEVEAAITASGGKAISVVADLADPAALPGIVDATVTRLGTPDILVNNAAWAKFVPIWEAQERHVQMGFQLNVLTPQALSQLVLPHMRAKGAGWIVNISSATADLPPHAPWGEDRLTLFNRDNHPTLYGTTKAALDLLTAGWAIELMGSGLAINALAPVGAVASEGALAVANWDERDHIESVEAMAEAALLLSTCDPAKLSGRVARSLPLLKEFGVPIRSLTGAEFA